MAFILALLALLVPMQPLAPPVSMRAPAAHSTSSTYCEVGAFTPSPEAYRKLCDGKMANDMFYLDFDDAPSAFDGSSGKLQKAIQSGCTPWIKWSPQMQGYRKGEANYGRVWDDILAGKFDSHLRACGVALAKVGKPLRLDFAHEMNGNWKPYGVGVKRADGGNKEQSAQKFVLAWRHVHDLVMAGGAKNVLWVWAPASLRAPSDPSDPNDTSHLYPGDAYTDEIGFSVYNKKARVGESFKALFGDSYAMCTRIAPSKPVVISEMGCSSADPNKAQWVTSTFACLKGDFPRVCAFNWFNRDSHGKKGDAGSDHRIDADPTVAAAMTKAMADPYFVGRCLSFSSSGN